MNKYVKQKTKKHYDEMIAWAETQNKKSRSNPDVMKAQIKQNWYGDSCNYCRYINKRNLSCSDCNLNSLYQPNMCCNGLWHKMSQAVTWGAWIKQAKLVRQYIIDNG